MVDAGDKQGLNQQEAKRATVVIKKYANRRLYNTELSRYVTLDDLCTMVKKGEEFVVVDAKTNEDLTRAILTQIIFEQETKGYNLLPVNFLKQIITFYDDSLSRFLPTYLESTMENFTRNQDRMRDIAKTFEEYSPFRQLEELGKRNMELFEQTVRMFTGGVDKDKKD